MKLLEILTITAIKKQQGLYKFFDKKLGSGASINEELANKLHQSVIEKLKEEESMLSSDLAEMRLLSSKDQNVKCVIDV